MTLNATHDPNLRSWLASANLAEADFPLQNLPHGVFSRGGEPPRGGVAIGDQVLDLQTAYDAGLFQGASPEVEQAAKAAAESSLNQLMALPAPALSALRVHLQTLLETDAPERARVEPCLMPMAEVQMHLPARTRAFTDFMTSAPHIAAERPARPAGRVPACFWTLPIGYSSRASSMAPSGAPVGRPRGQFEAGGQAVFGATGALDYELEFACFVGRGNPLGEPIGVEAADDHIFGFCLLNDWSARDFQQWESVLGPFQAKVFRTTISPWIVTAEALAPFRQPLAARPAGAPSPPIHLRSARQKRVGGLAIRFRAELRTRAMRVAGLPGFAVTETTFSNSAWSFAQMLAHHTSGGCNLETGDVLSSGTLSGPELSSAACLLEITGGEAPVRLPNGETRAWLEDGDELSITGRAEREGFVSIGFGPCAAEILPARPI